MVLHRAFAGEYVVQDDWRQHFWLRRLLDPQLFPNDLIANYFQSVSPWGFTTVYQIFASLGIDPFLVAKLLPPVLGLITTAYGFALSQQLLPIPFTGFLTALLLNQLIWSHDDIASATPRAFMPPIFLAFLYYLLRREAKGPLWKSLLPCGVTIVLEGLFYPQYVFVFAGLLVLTLVHWQQGRLRLSSERRDYWFCGVGLLVAFLVMLPFALSSNSYGPVITAAEARQLPEFYAEGRGRFFLRDPGLYWLTGNRSGLFPTFKPPLMGLGLLLPFLLRFPDRFPLIRQVRHTGILLRIVIVAFTLFFAAHALLFKLHLPSRYTNYTLRYVLIFSTAIVLTLLLEAGWRWMQAAPGYRTAIVWGGIGLIGAALLFYPRYIDNFPADEYRKGQIPELYQFFAQQPKDTLIASLSEEVDNIPIFSERSILVGREYAIPYHKGYANQFRQRSVDLIRAHYTRDPAQLANFIQTYGVDYWVVNRRSFRPTFLNGLQFKQYPDAAAEARQNMEQGPSILADRLKACTLVQEDSLAVVASDCLLKSQQKR